MDRFVLDTNVLLMIIPKKSPYRKIFDKLIQGEIEICITNEILSEYIEILELKSNKIVANNIGEFLLNSKYVKRIEVYYHWNLIEKDEDDNKFVDCAIAGNVSYLITNDQHFNILDTIEFPKVPVITVDDFLKFL